MARPKRPVVVRLTEEEAAELFTLADSGFGDGDKYNNNPPENEFQEEDQRFHMKIALKAFEQLSKARVKAMEESK